MISETTAKMPKEKYKNVFDILHEKTGVNFRMSKPKPCPCENPDEKCDGIMIPLSREEMIKWRSMCSGGNPIGQWYKCEKCGFECCNPNNEFKKELKEMGI